MSVKFQCRMPDYDGDDEWTVVSSYNASGAAEQYADQCDSESAMERFENNAEALILVKDAAGVVRRFNVSREFNPVYSATELDPALEPVDELPV